MIRVVMTHTEIEEACREWLENHGAPSENLKLEQDPDAPVSHGIRQFGVCAKVVVEAPDFGGPYR